MLHLWIPNTTLFFYFGNERLKHQTLITTIQSYRPVSWVGLATKTAFVLGYTHLKVRRVEHRPLFLVFAVKRSGNDGILQSWIQIQVLRWALWDLRKPAESHPYLGNDEWPKARARPPAQRWSLFPARKPDVYCWRQRSSPSTSMFL